MYVDRDIDRLMKRTSNRPLVTGVIQPRDALIFAIALEVVAFVFLWTTVNLLSAVLAVSATLFYVFVYTLWLKRTSTHNIVIGGAAGAVPVLVGLDRRHRQARLGADRAVRRDLLLDPAALLGPRHPVPRRLRRRRRADAAGRSPAPARPRPASSLYTLVLWGLTLLFAPVAGMGDLYLVSAIVLGAVFTAVSRCSSCGVAPRRPPSACSRGRSRTSRCSSAPSPSINSCVRGGSDAGWVQFGAEARGFSNGAAGMNRVRTQPWR